MILWYFTYCYLVLPSLPSFKTFHWNWLVYLGIVLLFTGFYLVFT